MTHDIEQFGQYKFEIFEHPDDDYPAHKWYTYRIYNDTVIEDVNGYETAQEARFAAIGHITKLENGEG